MSPLPLHRAPCSSSAWASREGGATGGDVTLLGLCLHQAWLPQPWGRAGDRHSGVKEGAGGYGRGVVPGARHWLQAAEAGKCWSRDPQTLSCDRAPRQPRRTLLPSSIPQPPGQRPRGGYCGAGGHGSRLGAQSMTQPASWCLGVPSWPSLLAAGHSGCPHPNRIAVTAFPAVPCLGGWASLVLVTLREPLIEV